MTWITPYSLWVHWVLSSSFLLLLSAETTALCPSWHSPHYTLPIHFLHHAIREATLVRAIKQKVLEKSQKIKTDEACDPTHPPFGPWFSAESDGGPVTTLTLVWLLRYRHRATASATASMVPPWHHLGDVLLVQGTASIQTSQPMRTESIDGGEGCHLFVL